MSEADGDFTIAARNNGFSKEDIRAAALASVTAYREAMAAFAQMPTMDIWYASLDENELLTAVRGAVAKTAQEAKAAKKAKKAKKAGGDARLAKLAAKRAEKSREKAHSRDSLQALSKLGEMVDGNYRIVSQPPIIVPLRDLTGTFGLSPDDIMPAIHERFRAYRATLPADLRHLLDRFQIVDAARKVVGVGSVGTRAFIVLLQGRDEHDPLFLQVKEATASVLEAYLPHSRFRQHGERVVQGQRLMQAASDIYLGWTKGLDVRRNFYWRQLRDMKGSALVEAMTPPALTFYAGICGWTLARAHARSGDPIASPNTSAAVTNSTSRSPASPSATPTRTSRTTGSSGRPSNPGAWKRPKAFKTSSGTNFQGRAAAGAGGGGVPGRGGGCRHCASRIRVPENSFKGADLAFRAR